MVETEILLEKLLLKLKSYCAYQERCSKDVVQKIYPYKLSASQTHWLINELTSNDFLNDARFAIQYAGGKFRINKWGKVKIHHALRNLDISSSAINSALHQISDEAYISTIKKLAVQKLTSLRKEENAQLKKRKVHNYLVQKGYEKTFVREVIK